MWRRKILQETFDPVQIDNDFHIQANHELCTLHEHMDDVHTYKMNWPLQPFSRDYNSAIYVACVNFIHESWTLQFNDDFKG